MHVEKQQRFNFFRLLKTYCKIFNLLIRFFYSRKVIFLCNPSNLVRFTAEFLNTLLKVSLSIPCQSRFEKFINSDFGSNKGSSCGLENRFQGHKGHFQQPLSKEPDYYFEKTIEILLRR